MYINLFFLRVLSHKGPVTCGYSLLHVTPDLNFHSCPSAASRWPTAHPAAQTPPQFVSKASASRPDATASSAPAGGLISAPFVGEMVRPVRRWPALWIVPGKIRSYIYLTPHQNDISELSLIAVSVSGLVTRMLSLYLLVPPTWTSSSVLQATVVRTIATWQCVARTEPTC